MVGPDSCIDQWTYRRIHVLWMSEQWWWPMTDDPFWKKPRKKKKTNVLKLDESMKFSLYQNLISAGIILKKASETLSNGISMDEAIWASIPAFLGMDAGWNTTTSLHTYHRNGQDLQHQIFGARNWKSTGATCCPAWTPAAVVSKPFHAECGCSCKTCWEFQERMAKMQHTRYTVYTWSHVLFM